MGRKPNVSVAAIIGMALLCLVVAATGYGLFGGYTGCTINCQPAVNFPVLGSVPNRP